MADNQDILEGNSELRNEVKSLCKYFLGLDKWVRRQEVIEARRQRYYWRNEQYIYWKSDSVGFVPASGGSVQAANNLAVEMPRYTDVYNIYTPYGESLLATLVQSAPGINWQPTDPSKSEDITASQTAEKYQQKIEKENDRKTLQSEVSRLFYTDGRTTLYTRRIPDKDGMKRSLITAHGVLETKVVPITAKFQEELVAYFISDEIDVYKAKDDYSDYSAQITENSSSLGESSYERIARLGVLQGTKSIMQAGDAFAHMVTRHQCFLRPSTFLRSDEKYRSTLQELFPNGLKVTFCGDTYCGAENISMDDELTVKFPSPGDGMSRPSLGKRVVPLQDVFNDEINLWHEAHDYCVPTLFLYSETADIEGIREQISQPGNIVPFTTLPPGAHSAADAFYAAVIEGIPETLPAFVEFIQGPLTQFISGAFPAMFGGDTKDNDTAKGIAIQRDQAMGRMGIPWASMQELFAGAYLQAVRAEVADEESAESTFAYTAEDPSGNSVSETIPIADLRVGSFKCTADTDSSFPETTNAKRATYQLLMASAERNPLLAEIISQPENMEFGHEVIGLPELVVPGAQSRNKQLREIDLLLRESPIPPNMDEIKAASVQNPELLSKMTEWENQSHVAVSLGQPAPQMPIPPDLWNPSIDIDPIFDFHQYELQTIKNWLSSAARVKEELKGNKAGIQNVRLHGLKHEKRLTELAAAQAMQAPPPAPKKGPQAAAPILNPNNNEAKPPAVPPTAQPAPKVM